MSLLFNMLSRLGITFLPRSKHLIISWLQSPSVVIFESKTSLILSIVSPSIFHEVKGLDAMIFVFWMLSFKPTFSSSSFTFIKRLFSSSSLSEGWCHLCIWAYWYFSQQSWLQLVLHPALCILCTKRKRWMVLSRVVQCTTCPTIHSSHVTHKASLQALQRWNSFHIWNWFHIHLVLITVLWDFRDSVIFPRLQMRKLIPREELELFYVVNTMKLVLRTGSSWFRAISTSNSLNPAFRETPLDARDRLLRSHWELRGLFSPYPESVFTMASPLTLASLPPSCHSSPSPDLSGGRMTPSSWKSWTLPHSPRWGSELTAWAAGLSGSWRG